MNNSVRIFAQLISQGIQLVIKIFAIINPFMILKDLALGPQINIIQLARTLPLAAAWFFAVTIKVKTSRFKIAHLHSAVDCSCFYHTKITAIFQRLYWLYKT